MAELITNIEVSTNLFSLDFEFDSNNISATEILKCLGKLLEELEEIDNDFLMWMQVDSVSKILLESIEVGSLKTRLKQFLEDVPDSIIQSGEIKKAIGYYLVKLKYLILKLLEEKKEIQKVDLQATTLNLKKEASSLGKYGIDLHTIQEHRLYNRIINIQNTINVLPNGVTLIFRSDFGMILLTGEYPNLFLSALSSISESTLALNVNLINELMSKLNYDPLQTITPKEDKSGRETLKFDSVIDEEKRIWSFENNHHQLIRVLIKDDNILSLIKEGKIMQSKNDIYFVTLKVVDDPNLPAYEATKFHGVIYKNEKGNLNYFECKK